MSKENFFSPKMKVKSEQELLFILSSKDYVIEAKHAAQWELEERGTPFEKLPIPEQIEKKAEVFKIVKNAEHERWKRLRKWEKSYYGNKLLVFGITLIVCAFVFFLPPMLTSKKSLVKIEGAFKGAVNNVEEVSSTNRWGYTSKSKKATLMFFLQDHPYQFLIFKNIGQDWTYPKYNAIHKKMEKSDRISVWIRKSSDDKRAPKVYQISIDDEIVVELNEVRYEFLFGFIFALLLGSLSAIPVLKKDYPEIYRRIFLRWHSSSSS